MSPVYSPSRVMLRSPRRRMPLGKLFRGTLALIRMVLVMLLMLLALSVLSLVRRIGR